MRPGWDELATPGFAVGHTTNCAMGPGKTWDVSLDVSRSHRLEFLNNNVVLLMKII